MTYIINSEQRGNNTVARLIKILILQDLSEEDHKKWHN